MPLRYIVASPTGSPTLHGCCADLGGPRSWSSSEDGKSTSRDCSPRVPVSLTDYCSTPTPQQQLHLAARLSLYSSRTDLPCNGDQADWGHSSSPPAEQPAARPGHLTIPTQPGLEDSCPASPHTPCALTERHADTPMPRPSSLLSLLPPSPLGSPVPRSLSCVGPSSPFAWANAAACPKGLPPLLTRLALTTAHVLEVAPTCLDPGSTVIHTGPVLDPGSTMTAAWSLPCSITPAKIRVPRPSTSEMSHSMPHPSPYTWPASTHLLAAAVATPTATSAVGVRRSLSQCSGECPPTPRSRGASRANLFVTQEQQRLERTNSSNSDCSH